MQSKSTQLISFALYNRLPYTVQSPSYSCCSKSNFPQLRTNYSKKSQISTFVMFGIRRGRARSLSRPRQPRNRSTVSNIVPTISDLKVLKWHTLVNFKRVPRKVKVLQREGDEQAAGGKAKGKVKKKDDKKKQNDKKDE